MDKTYLTRNEVVAESGKHIDTVRRYERDGKLPNSRESGDGVVELRLDDLVASGLLDHGQVGAILDARTATAGGRASPSINVGRFERELTEVSLKLAGATQEMADTVLAADAVTSIRADGGRRGLAATIAVMPLWPAGP